MSRSTALFLGCWVFVLVFLLPAGCAAYRAARRERETETRRTSAVAEALNEQIKIDGRSTRR